MRAKENHDPNNENKPTISQDTETNTQGDQVEEKRACYYCNKKGHLKEACRLYARHQEEKEKKNDDVVAERQHEHNHVTLASQFIELDDGDEFFFTQIVSKFKSLPTSWLLLDTESFIDIIANPRMVTNIRKADLPITLHCNAKTRVITHVADMKNYEVVWYYPNAIANILSLVRMARST